VPAELLSGDHGAIARWRSREMDRRTAARQAQIDRPRDGARDG
jgi:tRNA G37 N-methylase TrmD